MALMFTGIVGQQRTVAHLVGQQRTVAHLDGDVLPIAADGVLAEVTIFASIVVNGCHLTVARPGPGRWETEVSAETVARTRLGAATAYDLVSVERAGFPAAIVAHIVVIMSLGHESAGTPVNVDVDVLAPHTEAPS